ncbi:MAG: hypothetical protein U0941_19310 [Planctomycetaceae bacterium]
MRVNRCDGRTGHRSCVWFRPRFRRICGTSALATQGCRQWHPAMVLDRQCQCELIGVTVERDIIEVVSGSVRDFAGFAAHRHWRHKAVVSGTRRLAMVLDRQCRCELIGVTVERDIEVVSGSVRDFARFEAHRHWQHKAVASGTRRGTFQGQ